MMCWTQASIHPINTGYARHMTIVLVILGGRKRRSVKLFAVPARFEYKAGPRARKGWERCVDGRPGSVRADSPPRNYSQDKRFACA